MADLGDISAHILEAGVESSMQVSIPTWPDVSTAMPADTGSASTNPETFSAYIAG